MPDLAHVVAPAQFASPTQAYAALWEVKESMAQSALGPDWNPNMSGRGSQLEPVVVRHRPAPLRLGRSHVLQPGFFGFSHQHSKQFKQLRRLQAYIRWSSNREAFQHTNPLHGVDLWRSIVAASGFCPDFCRWWPQRTYHCPSDPVIVPLVPPSSALAQRIFDALLVEVRLLEQRLNQSKRVRRAYQHVQDRNLVFKEVKQPRAASVDTLLHEVETQVLAIDERDNAIVVPEGFCYDPALPLYVAGRAYPVIHFDTDTFWLEHVTDVRVGDVAKQSAPVGHLDLIFQAFEQQWRQRWCKHDALSFSHRDQIAGFVKNHVRPQPMQHLALDVPLLKAEIHRKKPSAACGLDGVTRADLVQADPCTLDSYLALYRHAEQHGVWPEQFMHGKVALLAKVPDASRPDNFRPISVFPLGYRLRSGAHARSLLAQTVSWVHPSVYGNRPGFQAAHLWSTVSQEIELAYASQRPLCGLVADVIKAFNCVPRYPVLAIAIHVGTPPGITTAWASGVTNMKRHFQVRNSFSPGFTTSTGVAEGCGLSVYAMLLIDHVFGLWVDTHTRGSLRLLTYVDNIECLTWDPDSSVHQLALVESFTRAFDLSLDHKKTYLWSTCPAARQLMRSAGHNVKHSARDVGGHVG